MPGFKHPCPYCSKFIDSGVAACPFCGVTDPFTKGRCPDCRAQLEPGWIACPKCGRALTAADATPPGAGGRAPEPPRAQTPAQTPGPPSQPAATPAAPVSGTGRCSGCGAALPAGASFCTACGTLVG